MTDAASLTSILLGSTSAISPLKVSLDDPLLTQYLTELPNAPLTELLSTPQSLTTQAHTLTSSLTSLTHTSYPTFLSLHATTKSLTTTLSSLSTSLDALITESLPALENAAKEFKEKSGPEVLGERTKARVVLEQHDKLRDLLDVPVLIDTCVRNGMYSEALSLATHASTSLASLSSPTKPLPLAASLNASISQSLRTMLSLLLSTLREPGPARKLPALWKAVNFIRRMEVLDEEELALAFLSGRGPSEEGKDSDAIDAEDVARFLKKYIDAWREGVYDIITQYSTIFLERPNGTSPLPSSPSSKIATAATAPPSPLIYTLITTYASHAFTSLLLPTLQRHLSHTPAALPSLLTQLTYCATAFARVGLDFRGLLQGLFGDAVKDNTGRDMRDASAKWSSSFHSAKRKTSADWMIIPDQAKLPPTGKLSLQTPAHVPPQILAVYPPIAEYANALLVAFNSLRLLAPVEVMGELVSALDQSIAESASVFLAYVRNLDEEKTGEGSVARAAGGVFVRIFVPFVRRALITGVYGGEFKDLDDESTLSKALSEWESWLEEEEEEDDNDEDEDEDDEDEEEGEDEGEDEDEGKDEESQA
ncbi:Dor1-domain-containing protein [Athelia psychrophila]|uniref:Conserved oligomeric Golgi complex subunit 8 n=1 Tax=Athelia psychrophila TaxID=1759441 RepID=A0A166EE20_9AGAM|nr:Dor1-domain-containing protein [Fibularhizoctonia sp. CBS 109695]